MLTYESVYAVTVGAQAYGQTVINTYHYLCPEQPPPPTADSSVANGMENLRIAWRANVLPAMPAAYVVQYYLVEEIIGRKANPNPVPGYPWVLNRGVSAFEPGNPALDTGTNNASANQESFVCASVRKTTTTRRRSEMGANRYGPLTANQISGNVISDVARASWVALGESLKRMDFGKILVPYLLDEVVFSKTRLFNAPGGDLIARPYTTKIKFYSCNKYAGSCLSRKQKNQGA